MKSVKKEDYCPPVKRRKENVDEILESLMSMKPHSQLDLWQQMITRHPFDKLFRTAVDNRLRFNIVSNVPYEIASYIMSFLSPQDLCRAAQTCRSWRIICEDNRLWREKCKEEGLLSDEHTLNTIFKTRIQNSHKIQENLANEMNSAGPEWKLAYLKHINILRNWRTRNFEIAEPSISQQQAMQQRQHAQEQLAQSVHNQQRLPHQNGMRHPLAARKRPLSFPNSKNQVRTRSMMHDPTRMPVDQRHNNHLLQIRCHRMKVITCLQYNPITNIIVSGSEDHTLKVWSSDTGKCITTLKGHSGGVWASQLSPDDIVISGSTDRTVRVWDAHSGKLSHTLYGHTSTVRCLALDGDKVVSGSRDSTLRLWDIHKGVCLQVFLGHSDHVRCVEFKNGTIVSGSYDYLVMVWDAATGTCTHTLECHIDKIYSLQFDGKTIASGSLDSTICIWDAESGKLKQHLVGHKSLTSKMQLKGKLLVSANADSTCKVWDVNTGECLHTLGGDDDNRDPNRHTGAITSVHFDNRHVFSSSDDGTVKMWDIKTGKFVRNLITLPKRVGDARPRSRVVWRIRASYTKLICATGHTDEETRDETQNPPPQDHEYDHKLLVLDFNE